MNVSRETFRALLSLFSHSSLTFLSLVLKKGVYLHHGHKEVEMDYQTDNRSFKRNRGRAW